MPRPPGGTVCFDCELQSKCDINCLPGEGTRGSVMIVGEKPGKGDIMDERPFRGLDGRKLNYLLERSGLTRDTLFVTHALKCNTPKQRPPAQKYLKACKTHLIEEVAWVRPKVIVTMGSVPLQQIVPDAGSASDMRGFPIPLMNKKGQHICWVIPTLSITQAVGSPGSDPIIARDMKLAKKIAKEGWVPPRITTKVNVLTDVDRVKDLVDKLWAAPEWSFDLETKNFDFLNAPILCASFAMNKDEAYVVPIDHHWRDGDEYKRWNDLERKQIIWLMKKAFASKAKKCAQNGKFDLKFLRRYGIGVHNFDFDTMLAHHLVDESKPHDLVFIAQWYGLVHEKWDQALEEQKKIHGDGDYSKFDPDCLYYYAGIDAAVTQGARPILEAELEKKGCHSVFKTVSVPQNHLLADMEYGGAKIDAVGMDEIIERTNRRIAGIKYEIEQETGIKDMKASSRKVVQEYFKKKRVRLTKKTKSGGDALDDEVLSELSSHPRVGTFASLLKEWRGLDKLKTTYLDGNGKDLEKGLKNKLDAENKLHSTFNIHGTYTGRLSSKGPNLQNIPKEHGIRQLFIPDEEDDILMSVDYKQLEVRVAAAIAKDPVLIKEIVEGVDMHSRNAAAFLLNMKEDEFVEVLNNKAHEDNRRFKKKRGAAKGVTFGVLYGSTAHGVSVRNNVPLEDCELFIKKFFIKYARLKGWIDRQHSYVWDTHRVVSPTGRFARFHDLDWAKSRWCPHKMKQIRRSEVERISVNMPIQGFGSDIFQTRCLRLFAYMKKQKMASRFTLSIHDGFVLNVKPNERAELTEMVPQIMHTKLNKGTRYEVPLDVDIDFEKRWEGPDEDA